jgi:hypothetical protein
MARLETTPLATLDLAAGRIVSVMWRPKLRIALLAAACFAALC